MTLAEEWGRSPDALRLLELLGAKLTLRGARLFVAAYCRLQRDLLIPMSVAALPELIERVADGEEPESRLAAVLRRSAHHWLYTWDFVRNVVFADQRERSTTWGLALSFRELLRNLDRGKAVALGRARAGPAPADAHPKHPWHATFQAAYYEYVKPQADLLRCLFANPHRPAAVFSPDWRTDTAVAIARAMYEAREFSAMPILADALQDAGCDNDDILNHCRDANQPHVRGCWVVDMVLGKTDAGPLGTGAK